MDTDKRILRLGSFVYPWSYSLTPDKQSWCLGGSLATGYPFKAPMRIPSMKYLWKEKKKMIMGMAARVAPAMSRP